MFDDLKLILLHHDFDILQKFKPCIIMIACLFTELNANTEYARMICNGINTIESNDNE